MQHRVRAAALITQGQQILLVCHKTPETGESYWVPPGGKLEACDGSIFECAQREVFEETGLTASCSRIVYVREGVDLFHNIRHLELFMLADHYSGEITLEHLPASEPDAEMIQEACWISQQDLQNLTVYPEILKSDFWHDLADGFPQTKYLGNQLFVQ
jgi:ADP-ribose pyrophosphatase YjhB (NUDIX family)